MLVDGISLSIFLFDLFPNYYYLILSSRKHRRFITCHNNRVDWPGVSTKFGNYGCIRPIPNKNVLSLSKCDK